MGFEDDLGQDHPARGLVRRRRSDKSTMTTPTRGRRDQITIIMKEKQIEIAARAADSSPITETMESNSLFTRREMLGITGMAGLAGMTALTGIVPDAVAQTAQKRPRIACLVSYWGLPTSHADWVVNKLIDGYWWNGAYTPSRVDVVSVYVHQLDTSLLAQKVCKAKNIPIYKSVGEACNTWRERTCGGWCCHRL